MTTKTTNRFLIFLGLKCQEVYQFMKEWLWLFALAIGGLGFLVFVAWAKTSTIVWAVIVGSLFTGIMCGLCIVLVVAFSIAIILWFCDFFL